MLTSGDLGRSLSPDPFDAGDDAADHELREDRARRPRAVHVPGFAARPVGRHRHRRTGPADLAARAGMRYNLGGYRRISLFVDEVSNVINQPLIEILNKGAEGGIFTTCAMQTLADLAKRLGSEDAARMALGNLNNLIALRSKDRPTQDFVVETFGKTAIHSGARGPEQRCRHAPGRLRRATRRSSPRASRKMVPADVLGKLPNLQYFARCRAGGSSGRFPILDPGSTRHRRIRRSGSGTDLEAEHCGDAATWRGAGACGTLTESAGLRGCGAGGARPPPTAVRRRPAVDGAVAREMASANQRLFGTATPARLTRWQIPRCVSCIGDRWLPVGSRNYVLGRWRHVRLTGQGVQVTTTS